MTLNSVIAIIFASFHAKLRQKCGRKIVVFGVTWFLTADMRFSSNFCLKTDAPPSLRYLRFLALRGHLSNS